MVSIPAEWVEDLEFEKQRAEVDAQIAAHFYLAMKEVVDQDENDWFVADMTGDYMKQYWERLARQETDGLQEIINGGETEVPDNS